MYCSAPTELKELDLDEMINDFDNWQKHTMNTEQELALARKSLEDHKLLKAQHDERSAQLTKEIDEGRHTTQYLQDLLSKKCDVEDDCETCKKTVADLENQLSEKDELFQVELCDIRAESDEKVNNLICKAEKNEKLIDTIIREKELEINNLKRKGDEKVKQMEAYVKEQLDLQKSKYESEMQALKQDYEHRIQKLQKQNNKTQLLTQMSGNQDIFRKKLQHVKSESEKQISALKSTICSLEERLVEQDARSRQSTFIRDTQAHQSSSSTERNWQSVSKQCRGSNRSYSVQNNGRNRIRSMQNSEISENHGTNRFSSGQNNAQNEMESIQTNGQNGINTLNSSSQNRGLHRLGMVENASKPTALNRYQPCTKRFKRNSDM